MSWQYKYLQAGVLHGDVDQEVLDEAVQGARLLAAEGVPASPHRVPRHRLYQLLHLPPTPTICVTQLRYSAVLLGCAPAASLCSVTRQHHSAASFGCVTRLRHSAASLSCVSQRRFGYVIRQRHSAACYSAASLRGVIWLRHLSSVLLSSVNQLRHTAAPLSSVTQQRDLAASLRSVAQQRGFSAACHSAASLSCVTLQRYPATSLPSLSPSSVARQRHSWIPVKSLCAIPTESNFALAPLVQRPK